MRVPLCTDALYRLHHKCCTCSTLPLCWCLAFLSTLCSHDASFCLCERSILVVVPACVPPLCSCVLYLRLLEFVCSFLRRIRCNCVTVQVGVGFKLSSRSTSWSRCSRFSLQRVQGILSRLLHDRTPGVRGEAVKSLALVAGVADASAVRWLLLLGEVRLVLHLLL